MGDDKLPAVVCVTDIEARVAKIEQCKRSSEKSVLENELYIYVLKAIANGRCWDPSTIAAEALKVRKRTFRRWYD
jgi:hypothetical protein